MSEPSALRLSPVRLLFALVLAGIGVAFVSLANTTVDATFAVLFALTVGFFLVSAFDAVRAHDAFTLAQAAWTALVFGVLALSGSRSLFLVALAVLAVFGAVVEAYNYVAGTSYLRIE